MACYGGLKGILSGLTKSTDHPSRDFVCVCMCGIHEVYVHTYMQMYEIMKYSDSVREPRVLVLQPAGAAIWACHSHCVAAHSAPRKSPQQNCNLLRPQINILFFGSLWLYYVKKEVLRR